MTLRNRLVFSIVVILLLSLAFVSPVSAKIIYVKTDGNDVNDGSSWELAKQTVQAGLNASSGATNDEVWVAKGTYVGCITLATGVKLYGGFIGNETTLPERPAFPRPTPDPNETVLDGNQSGSVVTSPSGATTETRIDGFTIRNGKASYGGGIYCYSTSSPTISNNIITSNIVNNYFGGGIYCGTSSTATISNNIIKSNSAFGGGGIYCSSSSPLISNNIISNNIADNYGGGIRCETSTPTISNNIIIGNGSGSWGGGIYCSNFSSATILNNTISSNNATTGGGIYCYSSATITNNNISGNAGGGIYCYISSATIANNTITGNCASNGGGICCAASSYPTISNNIVAFNSSGIYDGSSGTSVLQNNCVYNPDGYNYSGLPAGTGDISTDPKLADIQYGNVHIQPTSPCIDAGDDSIVQPGWLDIDSQTRVQGAHVDIGADESNGTQWPVGQYAIIRVSPDGDDANDGSSWTLAKRSVQAGIDAASAQGGEVWVATGMYNERIVLRSFSYLYGGFAGTESTRDERNWTENTSVLDGNSASSVVTAASGQGLSVIDGFTIQNGNAENGGGIYCAYSSPTISNNIITDNKTHNALACFGGGIYCLSSSPIISNNTISKNTASEGGGIYCDSASPLILNNIIAGNNAVMNDGAGAGGGIRCSHSSATIASNTIVGNSASIGGGIYCTTSSPAISNNIVAFNSSGICHVSSGTPVLQNNCVYNPDGYDYSGLSAGTGDISADPKLAGWQYGNFHIQPDSPCIDAGDDSAVQPNWVDMDSQARIQGAHVDIGADESDGTQWATGPYVIVRVSPSGNDENDGSSWESAKHTVQAGIDAASIQGGEVWVAAGTYNERIILRPFAYLYGGFAGYENIIEERDWVSNKTVLNGNAGGSVVTATTGHRLSAVDGFIITNGKADDGGGIYCYSSSPNISHNTITSNSNNGIYCYYSLPTIANNIISGNNGNGIHCSYSPAKIANNTITGNSEYGIDCVLSSSPTIFNNIISFNASGIYKSGSSSTPILQNNCVYNPDGRNYIGLSAGIGDISADPKLTSRQYGNVHIQPDSPCIDIGEDSVVQTDWVDMDFQVRVQGSHVDIGADESDATLWPIGPYVIVRVSPNGDDANDGSNWAHAKKTVQSGIDAASLNGGEVWVAAGTYNERIVLRSYAYLYGGFTGNENTKEERNWTENTSILDGNAEGSIVTTISGHWLSAIDGFTIRNGTGTLVNSYYVGGGIYSTSALFISNNTITDNSAQNGGGLYSPAAIISNNAISNNSASSRGGGIYYTVSSVKINYGEIYNNSIIDNNGEGIYCGASSAISKLLTISNNTISTNSGSGIRCLYASPTITSNIITDNTGGGIYCESSKLEILSNTIEGNSASTGGGIYCYNGTSSMKIIDNVITNNSADTAGGIYCNAASPMISNNIIADNNATKYYGGGICCISSSPTILNNTISGNSSIGNGGGLYCASGSGPAISNSIVAFNSSGIYKTGTSNMPVLRNNDLYGNTAYNYSGLSAGIGDISSDPLLVDRINGNYHLRVISPCINAGWNGATEFPATDMDGENRIQGNTVDIGADECWLSTSNIRDTKLAADSVLVDIDGLIITRDFPTFFYIESDDRSSGIRVDKADHDLAAGMRTHVIGSVATNSDGERYILATDAIQTGNGAIAPLGMSNITLGSGQFGLQKGVLGGHGLNNIGLLIKTWGKVTYAESGFFYLDDGSCLNDGSGHIGVKVYGAVPVEEGEDAVGKFVSVTGISSCEKPGADIVRIIRTHNAGDVVIVD